MVKASFIFFALSAIVTAQEPEIRSFLPLDDAFELLWEGGTPPFRVVERTLSSTNGGTIVAGPMTNRRAVISRSASNGFFRLEALGIPAPDTARYQVSFSNTWTAQNHPDRFPPGAHFSTFFGVSHRESISFWQAGGLATAGIKTMAELGSNGVLGSEFNTAIAAGDALSTFTLFSGASLSQAFPQVTLVAMIAPSPDWFVGVQNLTLFDGTHWVDDLSIELYPYDAGTDSGLAYISQNLVTTPPGNITPITGAPFLNGTEVRPIGTLHFVRE
ncbi:MAG: hypothetical protein ACI9TH_004135 [Kiritimatiellia bacterium]|jgi:hypothetical protein